MFLYIGVTVTDKEVKKGTQTTLTCSLTELSVQVSISWHNSAGQQITSGSSGYDVIPVAFNSGASTQGSKLQVNNPQVDATYSCKVQHNGVEVASKPVQLKVYDVTMDSFEVKSGTTATLSCKMSALENALTVTWLKSTGATISNENGYTISAGSVSAGNQVATLVVDSTLTQSDATYTCKVISSTYPTSAEAQVVAQLNVFDVQSVNKEVKQGSTTTISCVITGITDTATVTWRTSTGEVSGNGFTVNQGSHSGGTQTSTLALDGTQVNVDTAYACRVTSGSLPASGSFDTTVDLHVFGVTMAHQEIKSGTAATMSCVITGVSTALTVSWHKNSGETLSTGGGFTIDSGSVDGSGIQTSTLVVSSSQTTQTTTYTCRVRSSTYSASDSADAPAELKVYEVAPKSKEVKKGSSATISCVITGITDTAKVTWRTSTGEVSGDEFTVNQGSHSEGTQTSTLAVDGTQVNVDTAYTCRVTSGSFPQSLHSDTAVDLNIYDVTTTNKDAHVGTQTILTCSVTGLSAAATITWKKNSQVQSSGVEDGVAGYSGGSQTSTLTVSDPQSDGVYSCEVTSGALPDSPSSSTTAVLNTYSVEETSKENLRGTATTLTCKISGISEKHTISWSGLDSVSPSDYTTFGGTYEAASNTQTGTLSLESAAVTADATYTCTVTSINYPESDPKAVDVFLKVYDIAVHNREVGTGTSTTLSCVVSDLTQAVTVTWQQNGVTVVDGSGVTTSSGVLSGSSQTATLTVTSPSQDEEYTCKVKSAVFPESEASEETVRLHVYQVTQGDVEVKVSTTATLTCTITNILSSGVSVQWKLADQTIPDNVETTPLNNKQQVSKLTVSNPTEDQEYICIISSIEHTDSEPFSQTVTLEVFGVTPKNAEVKTGTETEISCIIMSLTTAITSVTWLLNSIPVSEEGYAYTSTLTPLSAGSQTGKLLVKSSHVTEDREYVCRVVSGKFSSSPPQDTSVQLSVYDVEPIHKDSLTGKETTLSCKITGLTTAATVLWKQEDTTLSGSIPGSLVGDTQTSTLTVSNPTNDEVYTCVVTSGLFAESASSETDVKLDVYSVQAGSSEVKIGTETTISCLVTEITAQMSIAWSGFTPGENFVENSGTFSSNSQTGTLTVKSPEVTTDTTYICSVASNDRPTSDVETLDVKLNVYDIELPEIQAKSGTDVTFTCTVSGLTQSVTFVWFKQEEELSSGINTGAITAGKQSSELTVTGVTQGIVSYTCKVRSTEFPTSPQGSVSADLKVFGLVTTSDEVPINTAASILCTAAGVSADSTIEWYDGETKLSTGGSYTVTKKAWENNQLEIKLDIASAAVTEDKDFICVVSTPGQIDQKTTGKLKTYEITTVSHDVAVGTLSTLTCSVSGVSASEVDFVWLDNGGKEYNDVNDKTYSFVEGTLAGGSQTSTLTLKETLTTEDQMFTCRITIGQQAHFDTEIPLKVFTVSAVGQSVQSGKSATLTCSVVNPTDTLTVGWYDAEEQVVTGTTKSTIADQTTVTELTLESQVVDSTYTCKVSGHEEYSFTASVEINDLSLKPEGESRVFEGVEFTLTCSYISTTISEGSFSWIFNENPCTLPACSNLKNTAKSSELTLSVDSSASGSWRCSFTKKSNSKEIKSNAVTLINVPLSGTQSPDSAWGIIGTQSSITCVVPNGLALSTLDEIKWTLDGNEIGDTGIGYNNKNEVVQFTFPDVDHEGITTSKKSIISFSHSTSAVGTLQCQANYNPERTVSIPSTHINLITLSSDVESIVITPTFSADVTFTTQIDKTPTTLSTMSAGTANSKSTKEESIPKSDGIVVTEVVTFSSSSTTISTKNDLSRKEYTYTYTINSGLPSQLTLSGKAFLIGETFIDSQIWSTIGDSSKITAHFTASEKASVSVDWQQKSAVTNEWTSIPSTSGYSTILSDIDDKGVISATIIIDKTKLSDLTDYRAQVNIASFQETTSEIRLNAVEASVGDVSPVFEKEAATFSASIKGPSKPSSVVLVHQDSGSEVQLDLTSVSSASPFQVSHRIDSVYFSGQGNYYFRVTFPSGLEFVSGKIKLVVKIRCKPLTNPPNAQLTEEGIAQSNNYKMVVTCSGASFSIMDENLQEAICNTSTGAYDKTDLSPCLRTIDPSG